MVFGCCCNSRPAVVREVKLACVGIDNSGKTTVLKLIKGEDPSNVLSTNGFSKVTMVYSDSFDICVYDLGGGERIRDIWDNYYAEVHGIIFVVDTDDVRRKAEAYDCINKVVSHKDVYGKPLLFVLNKVDHGQVDEIEFTNEADLHRLCGQYRQFSYVTHINKLNEAHLPKRKFTTVRELTDKIKEPFHLTFCSFMDKIIELWVALQEGVEKAEAELKQRQEAARAARKLRLMQMEHENRINGDVAMQEIAVSKQEDQEIKVEERELVSPPLIDSNLSSEVFEEEKPEPIPKNKIAPISGATGISNNSSANCGPSIHGKNKFNMKICSVRQKSRLQRVTEALERRANS